MARRKIPVKLILKLRSSGMTRNMIAKTQGISKKSVLEVFDIADSLGIGYDDVCELSDLDAYKRIYPGKQREETVYEDPDWQHIHKELAKVGVTLKLLHEEYCDECRESTRPAMSYDRFCKRYRNFTLASNVTSRVGHKAGRICEVDWSGSTMAVVDPMTGEVSKVYLFVGCLPFSRYTYAEPTLDMKQNTWLNCHVHMFEYFEGSPSCIVPDNLKTGVVKHPKDGEIVLNQSYQDLATHYSCAILPARVRKPKDKPSVENAVYHMATWLIGTLRNEVFTDFNVLCQAVRKQVDLYNRTPFSKRKGTRLQVFVEEEKELLRPLPRDPFEVSEWVYSRKVQLNSHIVYKHNYYSVSYLYVGETVDLRITQNVIEIYSGDIRLTTHPLFAPFMKNHYSTHPEDMPPNTYYRDWDKARIESWAKRIGPSCEIVTQRIFESVAIDEQGFNPILAILRLSNKYGQKRLENACSMALNSNIKTPKHLHIETILKTNQDKLNEHEHEEYSNDANGYVRGASYYGEL